MTRQCERQPDKPFCDACPDHEACATGVPQRPSESVRKRCPGCLGTYSAALADMEFTLYGVTYCCEDCARDYWGDNERQRAENGPYSTTEETS